MSSGYSLVQETADSIDEVTLSQVPTGQKRILKRALSKESSASRLMASVSREMSAGLKVIKDSVFKRLQGYLARHGWTHVRLGPSQNTDRLLDKLC